MISRTSFPRAAQLALRQPAYPRLPLARGLATSSSSGSYELSDVGGVKVIARDSRGPTTKLAVVAKAGTRYEPLPGLSAGLEAFAFKTTQKRSGLRIVRESELLGGQLASNHTREALMIESSFLRTDLPYYVELLGEVISQTKYTTHEFNEEIREFLSTKQGVAASNPAALALDAAHSVAFHHGLGSPLNLTSSVPTQPYLNESSIAEFAGAAYAKPNITIVADGASQAEVSKWVEQFFKASPVSSSTSLGLNTSPSKYYGGESRVSHTAGNSVVIAFPGSSYGTPSPETAVLAALVGGKSSIKWSSGFSMLSRTVGGLPGLSVSTASVSYSDAGLFTVQLTGSALAVRKAAEETVKALKAVAEGKVSKEDLTKAIAKAKFDVLEASEGRNASMLLAGSSTLHTGKPIEIIDAIKPLESVTADKLKAAAQNLLKGKASVGTVGDLHVLPYAEELGLQV
ncbi:cytochrome b-c1 complex subunit 2 [Sodiomyces alkalinus F11]|uniref:Cytochrome b-c1 complex subunit 2, mitochondrial n=1 Tax=Sodiomyces alkalinus (strain CBS 110278 / VKM F-3762 / F11) TaxID=1314773 RepID=A0A3N2Q9D0_SODAK|nr:cytochrome b-c1 complex subunit 2 [Sodiomyces alkalinus F11]ROT43370.1 cytochrome b-c1 complex subunit 2 [Sodiomyces alkalinus F11]